MAQQRVSFKNDDDDVSFCSIASSVTVLQEQNSSCTVESAVNMTQQVQQLLLDLQSHMEADSDDELESSFEQQQSQFSFLDNNQDRTRSWAQAMRRAVNDWLDRNSDRLLQSEERLETLTQETQRVQICADYIHNRVSKLEENSQDRLELLERTVERLSKLLLQQQQQHVSSAAEVPTTRPTASLPRRAVSRSFSTESTDSPQAARNDSEESSTDEPTVTTHRRRRRKIHYLHDDQIEVIEYRNGAVRTIQGDERITYFPNGDVETRRRARLMSDYGTSGVTHVRKDGLDKFFYPNGQIETYTGDRKIVEFPDGQCQVVDPDEAEHGYSFAVTI